MWVTAALGIACGLGRWDMAVISTVIALVLLAALRRIEALVNKPGGSANRGSERLESQWPWPRPVVRGEDW